MLTKRIIPCLDVKDGRVVKGVKFDGIKDISDPVTLAAYYNSEGADELVFYDISASGENRILFTDILKKVASQIFIPLTVGGGINTVQDFDTALKCGADKVSINSGAVKNPGLIDDAAKKYGSQCVVLSMDIKKIGGTYHIFTNGGKVNTGMDAIEWAVEGVGRGAGELVVNSIDTDGVRKGFDIELLRGIKDRVKIPIVASGGAGNMADFYDLFSKLPEIDAGLAASIFHMKEVRIRELKQYLKNNGIIVRI